MSAYMDAINARNGKGSIEEWFSAPIREAYPNLCEAFAGQRDDEGRWKVGPATLMLFCEAGQMKFCLSPKFYAMVLFGTVDDLEDVAGSVERSLQSGACEWKSRGGKK